MKRTLVIGDIHGGLRALIQVLDKVNLSKEDRLIFLGDYVDGWSESASTIEYLIQLDSKYDCIFIKGNHDKWCEDWLRTKEANSIWLFHGGQSTVDSYFNYNESELQNHLNFFESMLNYYIDDEQKLFIHAGFSSMHGVEKEPYESNYSWDRTLLEMALILDKTNLSEESPFYPKRLKHYSKVFIGHTPTTNYGIDSPIITQKLIDVDTGAAFKGKLTIMNTQTHEYWQSDNLPSLYPNEKGRN